MSPTLLQSFAGASVFVVLELATGPQYPTTPPSITVTRCRGFTEIQLAEYDPHIAQVCIILTCCTRLRAEALASVADLAGEQMIFDVVNVRRLPQIASDCIIRTVDGAGVP